MNANDERMPEEIRNHKPFNKWKPVIQRTEYRMAGRYRIAGLQQKIAKKKNGPE